MNKTFKLETTSFFLHIFAMAAMLCDHLWATLVPGNDWLTCVGRLAFPIFAFMLVEGYCHTRNLKKYALRLFLFALLSEIPFNLMAGGSLFYPLHQNVLWTFLISLGLVHWNGKKKSKKLWLRILVGCGSVVIGYVVGLLTMVDYLHAGILTVLVFYFFRGNSWWCYLGQLAGLYYINFEMLKGLVFPVSLFGSTIEVPQQGLAILSLVFIWLYRGRKGYSSKWFQQLCYWFYPGHMLLLWLIQYL